ncbi:MAG TPA: hypothetical protein V6D20_14410 [Candidatus Obscuribacterales bacterium]
MMFSFLRSLVQAPVKSRSSDWNPILAIAASLATIMADYPAYAGQRQPSLDVPSRRGIMPSSFQVLPILTL